MSNTEFAPESHEMPEGFDLRAELEALRDHPNDVLHKLVKEARAEQGRWRMREVLATRVLDERGALDHALPDATVSARTAKATRDVGRELESLPEIAAAAWEGEISWDQLQPLVEVATPDTDAEWARRGQRCSPADLHRIARRSREVSTAESDARREARSFRMWLRPEAGMFSIRGELPDWDGALAHEVFERMTERMRPAKGQPWASRSHRMADAFMDLVRNFADADAATKGKSRPLVMVQIPADGGAPEVNGVALAKQRLADYLAETPPRVTPQLIDDLSALVPTSNLDQDSIPAEVRRYVLARDPYCRTPGCENTAHDIHHMQPRCAGGNHDPKQLAGVCTPCHKIYEPHGPYRLVGDPDIAGDLTRVHRDEWPRDGPAP